MLKCPSCGCENCMRTTVETGKDQLGFSIVKEEFWCPNCKYSETTCVGSPEYNRMYDRWYVVIQRKKRN